MAQTILFISSAHKGDPMVRAVKEAGCRVLLLTEEKLRHDAWPWDAIDETYYIPELGRYQDVINTVSYLCRGQRVDQILPLDEFEVEIVAILREHLRLPGFKVTPVRAFRDKLAMREYAHHAGILVPPFIQIKNYDDLRDYFARVPPPWVLKPRMEAGSMGVKKVTEGEQVWRSLDLLGDKQSYYLLEQFIPGDVFHVDALTVGGKVAFASVSQYGAPPMQVYQGGGVFNTRIVPYDGADRKALEALNAEVLKALGMEHGASHMEFIRAHDGGAFYFLEVAARVGGANIGDLVEYATGINLWHEWGRLEVALLRGEKYKLPKPKKLYAGLVVSLAKQQRPDMSAYTDPEIVWRMDKDYHVGLIVTSKDHARVETLLNDYSARFGHDFMAVGTPMGVTRTGVQG